MRVIKEIIKMFLPTEFIARFQNFTAKVFDKGKLKYIEAHLTEHCNVSCEHCVYFCPVAEKKFTGIEQFEQDFIKLSKLTNGRINTVKLLGGEPTLNPDIARFIRITRENIPKSKIILVTNGTLLPRMNEEFWIACKENKIIISISVYPIRLYLDKIKKIAKKYKVKLVINKSSGFFEAPMLTLDGRNNPQTSYLNCGLRKCTLVKDGKIYLCAKIPYTKHLEKKFGVKFTQSKSDYLVLDEINNLQEISDFVCQPVPFCRYCVTKGTKWKRWRNSRRKKEEWIL